MRSQTFVGSWPYNYVGNPVIDSTSLIDSLSPLEDTSLLKETSLFSENLSISGQNWSSPSVWDDPTQRYRCLPSWKFAPKHNPPRLFESKSARSNRPPCHSHFFRSNCSQDSWQYWSRNAACVTQQTPFFDSSGCNHLCPRQYIVPELLSRYGPNLLWSNPSSLLTAMSSHPVVFPDYINDSDESLHGDDDRFRDYRGPRARRRDKRIDERNESPKVCALQYHRLAPELNL